jgi:hypothetical protein
VGTSGGVTGGQIVARTPLAGFPLSAVATPTILSYTTPNDGQIHQVSIALGLYVSVVEVGGGVSVNATVLGQPYFNGLLPGAEGVGVHDGTLSIPCDPNTTVTVVQQAALTSGTAVASCTISAQ